MRSHSSSSHLSSLPTAHPLVLDSAQSSSGQLPPLPLLSTVITPVKPSGLAKQKPSKKRLDEKKPVSDEDRPLKRAATPKLTPTPETELSAADPSHMSTHRLLQSLLSQMIPTSATQQTRQQNILHPGSMPMPSPELTPESILSSVSTPSLSATLAPFSSTQEYANIQSLLSLHNLRILQKHAAGLDVSSDLHLQLTVEAGKDIELLSSIIDKLKLLQEIGGVDVAAKLLAPLRPVLNLIESDLVINLNKQLMTLTGVSHPGSPSPG